MGDYIPIATLPVTTRMTSALRWAAMRAILMFHNCEGQIHKTVSTDHNSGSERRAEADSNRGPSAYQPNALPLGQTGSHRPKTLLLRDIHSGHGPTELARLQCCSYLRNEQLLPFSRKKRGKCYCPTRCGHCDFCSEESINCVSFSGYGVNVQRIVG